MTCRIHKTGLFSPVAVDEAASRDYLTGAPDAQYGTMP